MQDGATDWESPKQRNGFAFTSAVNIRYGMGHDSPAFAVGDWL
jgi:hypothetical protein